MDQQEQTRRERASKFIKDLVPNWRPSRNQRLWTTRIVVVLGLSVAVGYSYGITLWDWLKLLIVPAVIAAGGLWFNAQQRAREYELANEQAQDEALQGYLDQMSQLLSDEKRPLHRAQRGDHLSTVARARTLTVLTRLGGERKGSVVRFLYESGMINKDRFILNLERADLNEVDLSATVVSGANLGGTHLRKANLFFTILDGTNLSSAKLSDAYMLAGFLGSADLNHADLTRADLRGARLMAADLRYADLKEANLSGAHLYGADLSNANLSGADLSGAILLHMHLGSADLSGADLSGANLNGAASATNEFLEQETKSLEGATMPNGQTYEDWRKEREGHGEDG